MRQRLIALLLVTALVSGAVATAYASGGEGETEAPAAAETLTGKTSVVTGEPAPEGTEAASEEAVGAEEAVASGETAVSEKPAASVEDLADEGLEEVDDGRLHFNDLETLIRKNNLYYRYLSESMDDLDDLEDMMDALEDDLDALDDLLERLEKDSSLSGSDAVGGQTIESVQKAQEQAKAGLASLSGMGDPAVLKRQLGNGCNQLIIGAQAIFIALVGMEQQEGALERQMEIMNRAVQEMELRYEAGQVSLLQLMELKNTRTSLESGMTTLRMNIKNYKMKLEQMVGMEMTGTCKLGALPVVTDETLNALDVDADLKKMRHKSYALFEASAMEDSSSESSDAAYYNYKETYQQVELKFRTLYAQLMDQRQIVSAKESALQCEKLACQAAELKYKQGTISRNTLLQAEHEMKTAEEAVKTAKSDLFTTYNNYRWAVLHGVLN